MTDGLTRKNLYDLVWKKPMVEAAKEYGLSDRGLAKLCERHGIPVPPRGYWAKKQAGHAVTKIPLITLEPEEPKTIVLLKKAQLQHQSSNNAPASSDLPEDVQEAIERENRTENAIKVPATLANPHKIVARWIKEYQDRYDSYQKYGSYKPDKPSALENRRKRIFSALLKALEERGFKVEPDRYYQSSIMISHERDHIYFTIEERIRQVRRELTAEEKKDRWNSNQRWTRTDEPTGTLRLKLLYDEKSYTLQDFFEDEKPLEEQLNDVMIGVITQVWKTKKSRLDKEEREWQWRNQELLEQQQRDLVKKEQVRRQELESKADQWKKAALIREYVAASETELSNESNINLDEFGKWKKWALAHADEIDPIVQGTVMTTLAEDEETQEFEG